MLIEYDPEKSKKNLIERGLPFSLVDFFDWDSAIIEEDDRKLYPERRFVAVGYLGEDLHSVCFTPIAGGIRVISLRIASKKERKHYEQATTTYR